MAANLQKYPNLAHYFSNLNNKQIQFLLSLVGISTLILFTCSSLRHILFQSTAFDLGIFDQAVYLISQGQTPISSYMGYHILGDHAAFIWYPLALLYKIYPSVYWLFAVQALALSLGAIPTWCLARQAGLKSSQANALAIAYLLHPQVFNVNLFDFHPEVIALPALLTAIWCAREKRFWWFCLNLIIVLACKAVLSLTIAAMGIWLLGFEKRRWYGILAIVLGIGWFFIASGIIIPQFSGREAAAVGRFSYLGNSVFEIIQNLIFKPGLILSKIFNLDNFGYVLLLIVPIAWGLSRKSVVPLVGAIPCIAVNIIADYQPQKDLVHQYTIPALPFLFLAIIASLAAGKGLVQSSRGIIIWSLIGFLLLAKFTHFGGKYLESVDNWQATRQAISQVQPQASILTTAAISAHLSHRKLINLTNADSPPKNLTDFEYVLLNNRHPGWGSNIEFTNNLASQLESHNDFKLLFQRDEVYLFKRGKG
jgi:uncharacterized membrane protein